MVSAYKEVKRNLGFDGDSGGEMIVRTRIEEV